MYLNGQPIFNGKNGLGYRETGAFGSIQNAKRTHSVGDHPIATGCGFRYRLLTTSVRMRKFNLLVFHCLKRGFPSYVDASRQEGTILNGDARDHDVSTQGALAANIKVITCFTTTNYLAEHYNLPRCDISRNSAVSPHRHTIVR
jgi:hypothetical protein